LKTSRKIIIIIAHLTAWIGFFMLPFIFSPRPKEFNFDNSLLITHVLSNNIYLIIFFYFNTYFLIPKLLNNKYWFWYVVTCIIFLVGFVYVPKEIADLINGTHDVFPQKALPIIKKPGPPMPNQNRFILFSGRTALFFFVYLVSTSFTLAQNWLSAERRSEEIEHEKINTELSFLKSQINPHFFFNTLNNIYALAVTDSNQTAAAIMKLSSIMRYVISETKGHSVELKNEVDFVKNYIDLQLFRLTDKVFVDFKCEGNIEDKIIIPLLFMPFVENAFKYGVSTKEKTTISISLQVVENSLSFKVVNTIFNHTGALTEANGIGIQNVKRRLELVYPNNHTLQVFERNNQFHVELNINLK
jgi:Putative regulator of cell autolysis